MAVFTSWAALKTAILDDFANNPSRATVKSYTAPSGVMVTARSLEELSGFLKFIDQRIAEEDSGIPRSFVEFA